MASIQDYYNDLVDYDISGVTSLDSIPTQVTTAILPCKYVRFTNMEESVTTLSNTNGLPTYTFQIVFLIETVGQNTTPNNQTLCMTIAEATKAFAESIEGMLTFSIDFEINVVNNAPYWGLIATMTILGD